MASGPPYRGITLHPRMISLFLLTVPIAATSPYDFAGNPATPGPAARGVAGTILGAVNGPSTCHTGATAFGGVADVYGPADSFTLGGEACAGR